MAHKYLNKLGIKSTDVCIFNTEYKKHNKRYKKERKKYGFDTRETWNLDYTSATWLYEHLKLYKKLNICDLSYHKFNIPVLYDIPKNEIDINNPKQRYTKEVIEEHTQEECIDLIIKCLETYLLSDKLLGKDYNFEEFYEKELRACEALKCAFKIYAEIILAMWW